MYHFLCCLIERNNITNLPWPIELTNSLKQTTA